VDLKKQNLEADLKDDKIVITYCAEKNVALEFYAALCNVDWYVYEDKPEDERIIDILSGNKPILWSCSWRYAGGIIADIRNNNYNMSETYMDFYCGGNEGYVSPLVQECLERMGWRPITYNV